METGPEDERVAGYHTAPADHDKGDRAVGRDLGSGEEEDISYALRDDA